MGHNILLLKENLYSNNIDSRQFLADDRGRHHKTINVIHIRRLLIENLLKQGFQIDLNIRFVENRMRRGQREPLFFKPFKNGILNAF